MTELTDTGLCDGCSKERLDVDTCPHDWTLCHDCRIDANPCRECREPEWNERWRLA